MLRPELRIKVARAGEMDKLAAAFLQLRPVVDLEFEYGEGGGGELDFGLVEKGVLIGRGDQFEQHVAKARVVACDKQRVRLAALFDEAKVKFPTAAFAVFELDIDDWSQLKEGCGKLVHFARPRDLDPELGPEH